MPHFRYLAFDASGNREEGKIETANADQAWSRLVGLGLTVVDLVPDQARRTHGSRVAFPSRAIGLADQADLAEHLAVLFSAHLPTLEALKIAESTAPLPALSRLLKRTRQFMEEGQALSEALYAAGPGLSPLFPAMARVGDASAHLPELFSGLAASLRRSVRLANQIGSAMVYPVILIAGGILVFLLMTMYLAPRLEVIFSSANRPVPGELALFTSLGEFLGQWGYAAALLLGAFALAVTALVRMNQRSVSVLLSRLPFVGALRNDAALARLSAALGLLLAAGVPLVSALRETARAFPDQYLANHFSQAADAVEGGRRASTVFAQEPAISPLFRELFSIGEATNTLPRTLAAVTSRLEFLVERRLQRLLSLLTPALTLLIGGSIAFLVYSVMAALMSVNDLAF